MSVREASAARVRRSRSFDEPAAVLMTPERIFMLNVSDAVILVVLSSETPWLH